jgi:Chitobiase/beta-hexosaminidase C-terminal domain
VSANPKGGVYDSGSPVTLTSSDPAAKIFYTTDGTEPSAHSTPYVGPIQVEAPTTLKFMALGPADEAGNRIRSPISTETYE